ncbi:MAG: DNA polymerase IV [Muribaculaceae bacterium]|nr:DNA polymerase IV [Muribaculaceae bacterium]
MSIRKIIHIDMDAFYASVEQRDNAELRGRPVAVGQADGRGVVAAASYEARRFGVRSAMSSSKARKLCPDLVFVDCRFDVYKSVSAQIHDIFHRYTDVIEPISLDEAFLDVTVNKPGIELALDIAKEIKRSVRDELHLVASAGVSYNKFLAKIASDYRKPDGLCVIPPQRAMEFIAKMPVESFWGVGPVTAAKMHSMGIYTGEDLRRYSIPELRLTFGKAGSLFYNFARGIDNRPVEPCRERKSVGCEETLDSDISTAEEFDDLLKRLTAELCRRLGKKKFDGTTLTLKVRFADFTTITRAHSGLESLDAGTILGEARRLLDKASTAGRPVRLMGLSVSKASRPPSKADSLQLTLDL